MLAGESATLILGLFGFALFHTLVGRSEHLNVWLSERKLSGPGGGGLSFDLVDPVKEFAHGRMVAAGRLGGELHRGRLDLRNLASLPADCSGYLVAGGFEDQGPEIF
jgi:hypothetical protein